MENVFFFGYDEQHQRPFRSSADGKRRDWGKLEEDPEGAPTGPALAKFDDGSVERLPQITNDEVMIIKSAEFHRRGSFWTGQHADGAKLRVARRGSK